MTAATVGAIVFISGAVAITKPSRESLRVAPATSGAASSIGGIVATAPSVVPTPVVLAPPEPAPALSNDQAVVAPVLPSASSMGPRIGPASRHTGMVKGPGAFVPASAKTQDDLLLDRK
jgi:hypothetical protein